MKPGFGEANQGAMAGAVVGSIGGLFMPGLVRVILLGGLGELFATPIIGMICFILGGGAAWILGGQIGPRLSARSRNPSLEITGGVLGGCIPVLLIGLWAWYMTSHVV